jgi:hypothetical protein
VPPGQDRPFGTELLHQSARTRVTRPLLPGRTVIRKEPLGPDAERRLRHELSMLDRLRGVNGVAQLLEEPQYPGSIVLADGGASLAGLIKPLAADVLIGLGLQLAQAVAGMHQRGVMPSFSPTASNTPATICSPRPAASTWPGARRPKSPNWIGPTRPCGHNPTPRRSSPVMLPIAARRSAPEHRESQKRGQRSVALPHLVWLKCGPRF